MKRIAITVLLAVMSATGYAQKPIVFDLESTLRNPPAAATLNDLIEDISYIPLETHKEALLGMSIRMAMVDGYVYIDGGTMMSPIYVFNNKGRFVRQMTYNGRGPGENIMAILWYANAATKRIVVVDPVGRNNILVSTETCQRSSMKYNLEDGFGWVPLNDGTFVSTKAVPATRRESPKLSLRFMDSEGKQVGTIERQVRYEPDIPSLNIFDPVENYTISPNYQGNALLGVIYCDTIFTVKSRREVLTPRFVFRRGRYAPDPDNRENKRRYVYLDVIGENDRHVNISFQFDGKEYYDIWSKSSGRLLIRRVRNDDTEKVGFPYRLPDGSEIYLRIAYADSDRFYCIMQALDACKFLPGVKEDDNPVIVVAKLKK
jgi:hypothetical protein